MARRLKKSLRIQFREKDEWIYDEIHRLVKVKKDMGIDASVNFEVARILKRGLSAQGVVL